VTKFEVKSKRIPRIKKKLLEIRFRLVHV